jgi:hypothetical protein
MWEVVYCFCMRDQIDLKMMGAMAVDVVDVSADNTLLLLI